MGHTLNELHGLLHGRRAAQGTKVLETRMPRAGFEPARGFPQGILSPLCLPIPPPGLLRETCPPATTYASLSHFVSILQE